jgi:hypothetical protein
MSAPCSTPWALFERAAEAATGCRLPLGLSSLLEYNTGQAMHFAQYPMWRTIPTMNVPRIDSYRFGHLVVDGQAYSKDVIILPDKIIAHWWRKESHTLLPEDLEEVLATRPDLLIVGQGAQGRMRITDEARQSLEQAGIDLIAEPTERACETYNAQYEKKVVAAALHLTC